MVEVRPLSVAQMLRRTLVLVWRNAFTLAVFLLVSIPPIEMLAYLVSDSQMTIGRLGALTLNLSFNLVWLIVTTVLVAHLYRGYSVSFRVLCQSVARSALRVTVLYILLIGVVTLLFGVLAVIGIATSLLSGTAHFDPFNWKFLLAVGWILLILLSMIATISVFEIVLRGASPFAALRRSLAIIFSKRSPRRAAAVLAVFSAILALGNTVGYWVACCQPLAPRFGTALGEIVAYTTTTMGITYLVVAWDDWYAHHETASPDIVPRSPVIRFRPIREGDFAVLKQFSRVPEGAAWLARAPDVHMHEEQFIRTLNGPQMTHLLILDVNGESLGCFEQVPNSEMVEASIAFFIMAERLSKSVRLSDIIVQYVTNVICPLYPKLRRVIVTWSPDDESTRIALAQAGFVRESGKPLFMNIAGAKSL